jgi:5,6-dimethylbenzimidazole synthase
MSKSAPKRAGTTKVLASPLEAAPPQFDARFRRQFAELVRWRRDVRRFRSDPVDAELLERLLALAVHAPSVGLSQPWRFVLVETPARRAAIRDNFARANERALAGYAGERQARYARLKLEGLSQAPVHLVVCSDEETTIGHGLGRQTMPETLRYSVVAAIQTLWLAARAERLGVGWVSILDPEAARATLDLPPQWSFVAYLCIGWPEEEHGDPELERHGWQERLCEQAMKPLLR